MSKADRLPIVKQGLNGSPIAIKLFLRFAVAAAFINATGGRLAFWPHDAQLVDTWPDFLHFTQQMNPWMPEYIIPAVGVLVTISELLLALMLVIGFKTERAAILSGWLILTFGLAMITSMGFKAAIDNSVLAISGAAFGLSTIKTKYLEIDEILNKDQ